MLHRACGPAPGPPDPPVYTRHMSCINLQCPVKIMTGLSPARPMPGVCWAWCLPFPSGRRFPRQMSGGPIERGCTSHALVFFQTVIIMLLYWINQQNRCRFWGFVSNRINNLTGWDKVLTATMCLATQCTLYWCPWHSMDSTREVFYFRNTEVIGIKTKSRHIFISILSNLVIYLI